MTAGEVVSPAVIYLPITINISSSLHPFSPLSPVTTGAIIEDDTLYHQQLELSAILESAVSCEEAVRLLNQSSLAHTAWHIESWEPYMINTAI